MFFRAAAGWVIDKGESVWREAETVSKPRDPEWDVAMFDVGYEHGWYHGSLLHTCVREEGGHTKFTS